jgi:hypothetical protein
MHGQQKINFRCVTTVKRFRLIFFKTVKVKGKNGFQYEMCVSVLRLLIKSFSAPVLTVFFALYLTLEFLFFALVKM